MERKRKTAFKVMIAAYLVWQITAVFHIVAIEHHICPHGKIVHGRECEENHSHHSETHEKHDHDEKRPHDHCKLLLTLTAASVITSGLVSVHTAVVQPPEDEPEITVATHVHVKNILDVSPSNSPPSSRLSQET